MGESYSLFEGDENERMNGRYDLYLYDFYDVDMIVKVPDIDYSTAVEITKKHWQSSKTHDTLALPVGTDISNSFVGSTVTIMTPEQYADSDPFEGGDADVDDID